MIEWRHLPQVAAELAVERCQPDQFLGPVEGEDLPAAGVGVEAVGELGDGAGGFVGERQRQMVVRQALGQAGRVLGRLRFHAGQGVAFGLGFDDADGLGIGVEQIVGEARLERELPDRHAPARRDVHLARRSARASRTGQAAGRSAGGLFVRESWQAQVAPAGPFQAPSPARGEPAQQNSDSTLQRG